MRLSFNISNIKTKKYMIMQKKLSVILLFLSFLIYSNTGSAQQLHGRLSALEGITEVKKIESDVFNEKYVIKVRQPLDHQHPEKGSFTQRVIISHAGYDRPTVLITEGYGAAYAFNPKYREEISKLLDANMVFVEHRYFLESTPDPCDWQYLTVRNSAYDLHHIRTLLEKTYPGKWISTGISKGGQTTCFYRSYFPDDVDFSVPYVAPLNRGIEDGRHEPFLRKVGSKEVRKAIQAYQLEVLKRKDALVPMMEKYSKEKNLEYNIPIEEVIDYCVLEYSFSFWQWGSSIDIIPDLEADDTTIFNHLVKVCGPDYFSRDHAIVSFFVQAAKELGYYGYDTKPFKKYLSIKSAKGYLNKIMLPDELVGKIEFSTELYKKVYNFFKENDPKIIFIYGECDPWSAPRMPDFKNKKNEQIYIQPNGSHVARIHNMPEDMKEKIISQIKAWVEE